VTASDIRVYHVSPWRRWLLWYVIAPIILALAIGGAGANSAEGRALLMTAGIVVLIVFPFQLIIDWTRLELSPKRVRLRQFGYTLEAIWPEVTGLRLMRGSEGLITKTPLAGKGAMRLAAVRGFGMRGASLYDAEQQALLAERRLIPIEAFGWHLRRGTLRADITRFAPHLKELLDNLDAPDQHAPHKNTWKILAIIAPLLVAAVALATSPQNIQDWIIHSVGIVLIPLFTLRAAYSAWRSFQTRAWFLGTFFVLLTIVLFFWSVAAWIDFKKH
jgi:hypothetical protein